MDCENLIHNITRLLPNLSRVRKPLARKVVIPCMLIQLYITSCYEFMKVFPHDMKHKF